jgi:hypothetical protein
LRIVTQLLCPIPQRLCFPFKGNVLDNDAPHLDDVIFPPQGDALNTSAPHFDDIVFPSRETF